MFLRNRRRVPPIMVLIVAALALVVFQVSKASDKVTLQTAVGRVDALTLDILAHAAPGMKVRAPAWSASPEGVDALPKNLAITNDSRELFHYPVGPGVYRYKDCKTLSRPFADGWSTSYSRSVSPPSIEATWEVFEKAKAYLRSKGYEVRPYHYDQVPSQSSEADPFPSAVFIDLGYTRYLIEANPSDSAENNLVSFGADFHCMP